MAGHRGVVRVPLARRDPDVPLPRTSLHDGRRDQLRGKVVARAGLGGGGVRGGGSGMTMVRVQPREARWPPPAGHHPHVGCVGGEDVVPC